MVQIKRLEIFKDIFLKRRPKISLFVGISYTLSGSLSMKVLTNIPASRRKFTREVALFVGCAIRGKNLFSLQEIELVNIFYVDCIDRHSQSQQSLWG